MTNDKQTSADEANGTPNQAGDPNAENLRKRLQAADEEETRWLRALERKAYSPFRLWTKRTVSRLLEIVVHGRYVLMHEKGRNESLQRQLDAYRTRIDDLTTCEALSQEYDARELLREWLAVSEEDTRDLLTLLKDFYARTAMRILRPTGSDDPEVDSIRRHHLRHLEAVEQGEQLPPLDPRDVANSVQYLCNTIEKLEAELRSCGRESRQLEEQLDAVRAIVETVQPASMPPRLYIPRTIIAWAHHVKANAPSWRKNLHQAADVILAADALMQPQQGTPKESEPKL